MTTTREELISQWTRAGVAFNATPSNDSPDLERLLLDTARLAPEDPRLFILAATWLSEHWLLIASHRLLALAISELTAEGIATLGLLLDIVKQRTGTNRFNRIIKSCSPSESSQPLYLSQRRNRGLWALASDSASDISKKWGLWCQPFEMKRDALRPAAWIAEANPEYRERAKLRGDLRASILETLRRAGGSVESIQDLARRCCASRAAVTEALRLLEFSNDVTLDEDGRAHEVSLTENCVPA